MRYRILAVSLALSLGLNCIHATYAVAASSFSNSLTTIGGDSTSSTTQAAASDAGFTFFSTSGPNGDADPTIILDSQGATFGLQKAGDGGRNYMRTVEEDYASSDFQAEITIVASDLKGQDTFFGLGTGDTALFGWPDWSTQFSSVLMLPQLNDQGDPLLTTFRTQNDVNQFVDKPAPGLANGTHRLRMTLETTAQTVEFAIDIDYTSGPFTADVSSAKVDVSTLYAENGWEAEPSRIYFGGDDGIIFRDFSVNLLSRVGDLNGDGAVDAADAGIMFGNWANSGTGDLNSDGIVDAADAGLMFAAWTGDPAPVGAVPEPAGGTLLLLGVAAWSRMRKGRA